MNSNYVDLALITPYIIANKVSKRSSKKQIKLWFLQNLINQNISTKTAHIATRSKSDTPNIPQPEKRKRNKIIRDATLYHKGNNN